MVKTYSHDMLQHKWRILFLLNNPIAKIWRARIKMCWESQVCVLEPKMEELHISSCTDEEKLPGLPVACKDGRWLGTNFFLSLSINWKNNFYGFIKWTWLWKWVLYICILQIVFMQIHYSKFPIHFPSILFFPLSSSLTFLRWCCWTTFRGNEMLLGLSSVFHFRVVLLLAAVMGTMGHWDLAKDLWRPEPTLALEVARTWEKARCCQESVWKLLFESIVVRDCLSSWRENENLKKLV